MLWVILTLMTVLAAVGLAVPLIRRHDAARAPRNATVEVLKAQLGEIETQTADGALPPAEAEALKSDVKRRVLAEGRAPAERARPLSERALLALALGVAAAVVLAATGLYLKMGRPDVASVHAVTAATATAPDPGHPQGDVASMIALLESRMKQTPGNADGWRMLGWSYLQVGRNAEAAVAYSRAAAIEPDNAEYLSAQGEATVLAAQGQVTHDAQAAFKKALFADPTDPRARYYLAMAKDQAGDAKGAMDDWIVMLRTAPADAPWVPEVRAFVIKVAESRGQDITARLPPTAPPSAAGGARGSEARPAGPQPGPTADQVAAAGQMSDQARAAMVQGMVAQLAARLKANPHDREGWERLIRARMVLGRPDQAAADYRDAARAFEGAPTDQAALRQTARSLGVPGV
jgi:cytochrome c-type biogenesis protein CcmH